MARKIEDCRYRVLDEDENARCDLLVQLTGIAQWSLATVASDACEACCQSFPPSLADINPVIASLLYAITDDIVESGGVAGCESKKASELRAWSEHCLPRLNPNEEDSPTLPSMDSMRDVDTMDLAVELPLPTSPIQEVESRWAIGITTTPRRVPTLDQCLDSLERAGWSDSATCDVRLFMDEPVEVAERHEGKARSIHQPKLGAWPNYYLSLTEMLMRHPNATAYMMVQDDVLFFAHPRLREYLEQMLWPKDERVIYSLFCPRDYTQTQSGWTSLDEPWFWGALAFVFPQALVSEFLTDVNVMSHRWRREYGDGLKGIDVLIGQWAAEHSVTVRFPSPSLVQHIGEVSTIWNRARATGPRRAESFLGDQP